MNHMTIIAHMVKSFKILLRNQMTLKFGTVCNVEYTGTTEIVQMTCMTLGLRWPFYANL